MVHCQRDHLQSTHYPDSIRLSGDSGDNLLEVLDSDCGDNFDFHGDAVCTGYAGNGYFVVAGGKVFVAVYKSERDDMVSA